MGGKMGEIEDIGISQCNHDIRHRTVVAASRVALIFAHPLHEIVLALADQERNILFAGKVLVMIRIAPVLLDQSSMGAHALDLMADQRLATPSVP